MAGYRERFGDDYYSFWCGGSLFLVVNTPLLASQHAEDVAAKVKHLEWLHYQLFLSKSCSPQCIVLGYHPIIHGVRWPYLVDEYTLYRRLATLTGLCFRGPAFKGSYPALASSATTG